MLAINIEQRGKALEETAFEWNATAEEFQSLWEQCEDLAVGHVPMESPRR